MKDRSRQIDRYLDGSLEADEIADLFAWLAESPQNAEVFARQSLLDQHLAELLDGGLAEPSEKSRQPETVHVNVRSSRRSQWLMWAGGFAAALLIVCSLVIALIQSKKEVADLRYELGLAKRDAATAGTEETAIINFYAREHQEVVARHAALRPTQPEPMQVRVSQNDILYYELLDDLPETTRPGMIVRGPLSQGPATSPTAPVLSNGHSLSLSQAKEATTFDLVAPAWLDPGFALDEIRNIEGRDAMQLLYTNGIASVSLFEQPLDGPRGLSTQEFREYAVYSKAEGGGGTILAWRDAVRSYVLIGKVELSQLMDMAQSISNGQ